MKNRKIDGRHIFWLLKIDSSRSLGSHLPLGKVWEVEKKGNTPNEQNKNYCKWNENLGVVCSLTTVFKPQNFSLHVIKGLSVLLRYDYFKQSVCVCVFFLSCLVLSIWTSLRGWESESRWIFDVRTFFRVRKGKCVQFRLHF